VTSGRVAGLRRRRRARRMASGSNARRPGRGDALGGPPRGWSSTRDAGRTRWVEHQRGRRTRTRAAGLVQMPTRWPVGRPRPAGPGRSGRWQHRRHGGRTIGCRGGVRECGDRRQSASPGGRRPRRGAGRGGRGVLGFCESHARDVPVHDVTAACCGRAGRGRPRRRSRPAQLRVMGSANGRPQDLLLLRGLVGIADPEVALPTNRPGARRRRWTALINSASLARTEPRALIIEDVLDRRVERVVIGRLSVRHPADQVGGADHLPPRLPRER